MERKSESPLLTALALCAGVTLIGCPSNKTVAPTTQPAVAKATIEGRSGSTLSGEATFTQSGQSLAIHVQLKDATPGQHGLHIHEKGDCSDIEAKSAGPHFNPTSASHGGPGTAAHHAGDLGNLTVGADGTGVLDLTVPGLTIEGGPMAIAQRAIVVHEKIDDLATQPTGASGGRIGCGVIVQSKAPPQ